MKQPSRRQFISVSLAGLPVVTGGAAALVGMSSSTLDAATQQTGSMPDPILDAIAADYRELIREGNANPSQRRSVLRATEALIGVLAAHVGQQSDAQLRRVLRQQLQRKGRQAVVQEFTATINKPEITHEKVDATLTRLEREGFRGLLLEMQKRHRQLRDNTPADYLQVRAATQYDFCADLRWFIELAEMSAAIACGLAAGSAGLNPAMDAACSAASLTLAGYLAMRWWYGC